jgi:inner membrane protein
MDSLTQIVLGAAVGELLLGRRLGNKAMLLGAIGGTLPDLDVIYNFFDDDPIAHLKVHRAYSHSLFTHIVLAWPLAWLSVRWRKLRDITFGRWYLFWFLALFTHALLDCCTTYGTRLFLPFTDYQVAFNNISVIDPLYTIPFMLLLGSCLFMKRDAQWRRRMMNASLIYSSSYMLLTFGLKYAAHQKFREDLQARQYNTAELNTTPTILNAVLWSAIAYNDSMIYVSEFSFLRDDSVQWTGFRRNLHLEKNFDSDGLRTMKWFSDGNYFLQSNSPDTLSFFNIKWGRGNFSTDVPEKAFMFYFRFYENDGTITYTQERDSDWKFSEALKMLTDRIGI